MKRLIYSLLLPFVMVVAGCSKMEIEPTRTENSGVAINRIVANIENSQTESKVAIVAHQLKWSSDDYIYVAQKEGSWFVGSIIRYNIDKNSISDNGKYAEFVGEGVESGKEYVAFTASSAEIKNGVVSVDATPEPQSATNSSSHINNSWCLYSGVLTTSEFENTFMFKNQQSILAVTLGGDDEFEGKADIVKVVFTAPNSSLANEYTINGSGNFEFTSTSSSIELEIENGAEVSKNSSYIANIPFGFSSAAAAGEYSITAFDSEGGEYTTYFNMPEPEVGKLYTKEFEISESIKIVKDYVTLSELSTFSYPENSDAWVITDSNATSDDFKGLREAITMVSKSGKTVSLEFPNLEAMPQYAFLGMSSSETETPSYNLSALVSISAPNATKVETFAFFNCSNLRGINLPAVEAVAENGFYNCKKLTTISLPLTTTVADYAFRECSSLDTLIISTANGAIVNSLSDKMLNGLDSKNITLILGEQNSDIVWGDHLVTEDFTSVFYEIVLVDAQGNSVSQSNLMLKDFNENSYPQNSDIWIIDDTEATMADFEGLFKAINVVENTDRKIELIFPNIKSFPDYTFGYFHGYIKCVNSLYAPKATKVGVSAFDNFNGLTSIKIPNVETIESSAFADCQSLLSLELPKAKVIKSDGFYCCESMVSIDIPEVVEIGNDAFKYCDKVTRINMPKVTSIGESALVYIHTDSLILPQVTTIGSEAFKTNHNFKYIELATGEGVRLDSINPYAFGSDERAEADLVIGEANKDYVFGNTLIVGESNIEFKSITIVDKNGVDINQKDDATPVPMMLNEFSATNYPTEANTWIIEDETATASQFIGLHDALTAIVNDGRDISIEFPNLKYFPDYALMGGIDNITNNWSYKLLALKSVSAPNATSVGEYALVGGMNIAKLEIPEVSTIEKGAFAYTSIEKVSLQKLTSVSDSVFYFCNELLEVDIPLATSVGESAFEMCNELRKCNLPQVTTVKKRAFSECSSVKSSTDFGMPLLTEVGESGFNLCNISSIDWLLLKNIRDYGFLGCSEAAYIDLPQLVSMGVGAFSETSGEYVNLPKVEDIPDSAFCSSQVVDVYAPNSKSIGKDAFYGSSVEVIDMPLVKTVGEGAFTWTGIKSINLPLAEDIKELTFGWCTNLKKVNLPSVKILERKSFFKCASLISVELESVATVEYGVFQECLKLQNISLPSCTSMENSVFYKCDDLISISLATNKGARITYLNKIVTSDYTTYPNISLTVGSDNSSMVKGNTITVGSSSLTFKDIDIITQ